MTGCHYVAGGPRSSGAARLQLHREGEAIVVECSKGADWLLFLFSFGCPRAAKMSTWVPRSSVRKGGGQ